MPTKKVYRCEPCNFEYEHLSFGTKWDKAVPPCSVCGKAMTYEEPEISEDYVYNCLTETCKITFSVEHLTGQAPKTYPCPLCSVPAPKKLEDFAIVHGKTMNKGASVDVAIGRSAEERWGRIHERKAVRDKFRKETGTQALSITESNGQVFGKPIKDGRLAEVEATSMPKIPLNKNN